MNKDLAPQLTRSWLVIELQPRDKSIITSNKVKQFQIELAEICGMRIFCGPMILAPDTKDELSPYYANKAFKPKDWNAFTWWTRRMHQMLSQY